MSPILLTLLSLSTGQVDPPGGPPNPLPQFQPAQLGQAEPPPVFPEFRPAGGAAAAQPQPGADQPGPKPLDFTVNVPPPPPPAPATPPAAATPPDRWALMRALQGTWYGAGLDDNRTAISGWFEGSYTASTVNHNAGSGGNSPVVWNDRANRFLLQQAWFRLDRSVVTSGTTDITWGYRVDVLSGTDYRFTQQRGLFNSQLESSRGLQNLYGVDPLQFYANMYIPTLFEGTDVRAGRLYTPFGYESLEAISTPFASRSYAFNWSPPFTHMGIMVSPTFNKQWSGRFMLANGNDVWIGNPAEEMRAVGAITWTSLSKADSATFGFSLGRGKFNAGSPFAPSTLGEQNEPAGRNNLNVLDLVYTHIFNPKLNYAMEVIYGWQSNVPANVPGGIVRLDADEGTAHWGSVVQYLNWNFAPWGTQITRVEMFDDFNGQRTGFVGFYQAVTVGAQIRPYKWMTVRPEIRYDHNGYSTPFNNGTQHSILTAAFDFILRW
ncbi:MAG: hypothetical protein JWO38_702 [Gemmataceae bacterium]|nr:hypothetical protein [Gemmataceae bacterium]